MNDEIHAQLAALGEDVETINAITQGQFDVVTLLTEFLIRTGTVDRDALKLAVSHVINASVSAGHPFWRTAQLENYRALLAGERPPHPYRH